jgi:hypothetical protein
MDHRAYEISAFALGAPQYIPIGAAPGLTPEQVKLAAASADITRRKRKFAKYVPIHEKRNAAVSQTERTEVNCRDCTHCLGHNAEHNVGWCGQLRFRVSTWHPVYCNGYAKRPA